MDVQVIDTCAESLIHRLREVGGAICTDGEKWQLHIPPGMPVAFVELLQRHALMISARLYIEQKDQHER